MAKGKLHLKTRPDGYGYIYGVWQDGEDSVRVDIMPPRAHWDGDMMLPDRPPHDSEWVVYANGEEIARVKADNVMGLEGALRALPAPLSKATAEAQSVVAADTPRTVSRALRDPVWWAVVLASVLGLLDQRSLWAIVSLGLLAVLLTLWSCVSDQYWFDQFRTRGLLPALAWFWLQCLAMNAGFITAAYAAGHATRWLWL